MISYSNPLLNGRNGTADDRPRLIDPSTGQPFADTRDDEVAVPHVWTFSSLWNAATRAYSWRWDEAYKHNRENALAMRRDCGLMGLLRERQYPVIQAPWHLEGEDPDDPEQQEVCERLDKDIQAIPNFQMFRFGLQEAVWYGRYGQQWALRWQDTSMGRRLRCAAWEPVNGDKIQHLHDHTPCVMIYAPSESELQAQGAEIVLTEQSKAIALRKPEWRQRFVLHTHEIDDADYWEPEMAGAVHGVGIRSRIYWVSWHQLEIQSWLMDYLERTGLGLTIFFYDESNPSSKTQAEKAARESGRNTVIVWPRSKATANTGAGVERIETSTAGCEVIMRVMEYFDAQKQRYIVGQTLSSDHKGSGGLGGSGAAEFQQDTKHNITRFDAENAADTMTRDVVKVFQQWNEPQAKFDIRMVMDLDDPNGMRKLNAAKTAYEMGARVDEQHLLKKAGLPIPDGDEEDGVLSRHKQELELASTKETWHDRIRKGEEQAKPTRPQKREKLSLDGQPLRFAAEAGHWITIHGEHVYIENGVITKGPAHLVGRKPDGKEPEKQAKNAQAPWQMTKDEFRRSGIQTFSTAQGSLYAHANGQTLRVKTPHMGHETKDVGLKRGSQETHFIDPEHARRVGMWNTSSASGKRLIVDRKNKAVLLTSLNAATGQRGLDERFPIASSTPRTGLSPLELTDPSSQGEGWFKGNHPGNAITDMHADPGAFHREFVSAAMKAGKTVPANVLREYPDMQFSANEPLRFAAEAGHWVTMHGEHVYIEDGKITQGPEHLVGRTLSGSMGDDERYRDAMKQKLRTDPGYRRKHREQLRRTKQVQRHSEAAYDAWIDGSLAQRHLDHPDVAETSRLLDSVVDSQTQAQPEKHQEALQGLLKSAARGASAVGTSPATAADPEERRDEEDERKGTVKTLQTIMRHASRALKEYQPKEPA